jgi:hypothetical protein
MVSFSWLEWQRSADANSENWATNFLEDVYDKITKDKDKRLKPEEKKVVSTKMNCNKIVLEYCVPPLLYMGLVNVTWQNFERVGDIVEVVSPREKEACKALSLVKETLFIVVHEWGKWQIRQ